MDGTEDGQIISATEEMQDVGTGGDEVQEPDNISNPGTQNDFAPETENTFNLGTENASALGTENLSASGTENPTTPGCPSIWVFVQTNTGLDSNSVLDILKVFLIRASPL